MTTFTAPGQSGSGLRAGGIDPSEWNVMTRVPAWLSRPSVLPLRVFVTVTLLAFTAECAIMIAIHRLGLEEGSLRVALLDATVLTALLSPAVWLSAVRPLRGLFEARGQLLGRLFEAQEQERGRLARELHDDLGQQLTAILVRLRADDPDQSPEATRERIREGAKLVAAALDSTRRLARGLRPPVLEDLGLGPATERLCEDFESAHNLPVTLRLGLVPGERFPAIIENNLFRILQESLTNVARHARASSVRVSLAQREGSLELNVHDDGAGFDLEHAAAGQGALGLRGMRERASLAEGDITIVSSPGQGTHIKVLISFIGQP